MLQLTFSESPLFSPSSPRVYTYVCWQLKSPRVALTHAILLSLGVEGFDITAIFWFNFGLILSRFSAFL